MDLDERNREVVREYHERWARSYEIAYVCGDCGKDRYRGQRDPKYPDGSKKPEPTLPDYAQHCGYCGSANMQLEFGDNYDNPLWQGHGKSSSHYQELEDG